MKLGRPLLGPRRALPPPRGHEADRNGEPAEGDWSCFFMLISLAAIIVVLLMLLIAATFPVDRVYTVYA